MFFFFGCFGFVVTTSSTTTSNHGHSRTSLRKFQNQMIAFDNLKIEMNELAVDLDQQLSDKQSLILQQEQDHKQKSMT